MDSEDPVLISVCMATKDGMPHVREAIEGLKRQTYPHFELIVQDAVSTDGTLEYLRGLDVAFPVHIVSEPDGSLVEGYSRAWNRATGPLLVSGACDEVFEPDAFEQYVRWSEEHPDAVFVYSSSRLINADGETVSEFIPQPFDLIAYLRHDMCPTAAGAFNRRVLGDHCRLDERIDVVPDFELYTRLALVFGEHRLVAKTKVTMSARADGVSQSYSPRHFRYFAAAKDVVVERLLTGELQTLFTNYMRRDVISRMQVSFARMVDSIEGPGQIYAEHVLAAARANPHGDLRDLALKSPYLDWSPDEGVSTLPLGAIPAVPDASDPVWPQSLDGLQGMGEAIGLERLPAGVHLVIPEQERWAVARLALEIPVLSSPGAFAWIRIRYCAAAGSPRLAWYDSELREVRREFVLGDGEGEILIPFSRRRGDSLLVIASRAVQSSAVTLQAVDLVGPALGDEQPLSGRLHRRSPLGPDEVTLVRAAISGLIADGPTQGWERLAPEIAAIAASGPLIRDDFGLAEAQAPVVALAANRALQQALSRTAGMPVWLEPGHRPAARLCSQTDWQDPAFVDPAVLIFGLDVRLGRFQSRWAWERAALLAAVGQARHVLVVSDAPDASAPMLAHLGAEVVHISTAQLLEGAGPDPAWPAFLEGFWLGQSGRVRDWSRRDTGRPFDGVVLLSSALALEAPRLDALFQAIRLAVAPDAVLASIVLVQLNGQNYGGAISLTDWDSLFGPDGRLGARGFTAPEGFDPRIPADSLARFGPSTADDGGMPALTVGTDGSCLAMAVIAARWPERPVDTGADSGVEFQTPSEPTEPVRAKSWLRRLTGVQV